MARPKGGYKLRDGTKVPGVTTIIGRFKDSGALLHWAFEQGKLAQQGLIENLYDKRDQAADAGTLAHEMVEATIANKPLPDLSGVDPIIAQQAKQGFDNWKQWSENNMLGYVAQEISLVSEKYKFGGTIDAICEDTQGRLCVVDWKTSNGIFVDHILQCSAYCALWDEAHPDKPITGGFHLCRFAKEHADFAHHYWSELNDAWEQFTLFLRAYELDKKLKKRV